MPNPLSLKFMSTFVCMRSLLLENDKEENVVFGDVSDKRISASRRYLTRLLETDCFTAVSEDILYRLVKFRPSCLTNDLVLALTPPYIHDLNLARCMNVTLLGLCHTLKKCRHVHRLNLSGCSQMIHPEVFTFTGLAGIALTTVIVEENVNVTDEVVHSMLKNIPCLETLNISGCLNTSNDVFLLDENIQLMREISLHPIEGDEYKCNLTSVDISCCRQLDTRAVKHLVSLCGPKLIDVNISYTSVNCTALLHLAGYSTPAILDMILTDHTIKADKELKEALQDYRELRDKYAEQFEEALNKKQEPGNEKNLEKLNDKTGSELNGNGALDGNNSGNSAEVRENDILCEADVKIEVSAGLLEGSQDENNDLLGEICKSLVNRVEVKEYGKDVMTGEDMILQKFNNCAVIDDNGNGAYKNSDESVEKDKVEKCNNPEVVDVGEVPAREYVYYRNGDEVIMEQVLQDPYVVWDSDNEEEHIDKEKANDIVDVEHVERAKNVKELNKCAGLVPIGSDKLNFEYSTQLFEPKILRLNIASIKFVSRRPNLGHLCVEKFLKVNQGLQKFSISWKGLTMDFFKKIVPYLKELIEVDLEECTMLTSGGVAALGKHCRKCRRVNLRGVVFISDGGLAPFLSNKNLQHLSLAESDNISDRILIKFSTCLSSSLTSLDLSWCEEISEKGLNAICSTCTKLKRLWLRKCPASDFTVQVLAESNVDLVEISIESTDTNDEFNLTDAGILTVANAFTNLRIVDISWNLALTDVSISALMMNCYQLEDANLKGLKQITIKPFLPIISDLKEDGTTNDMAGQSTILPQRSTVYAPNLCVLDLDYSDLVDDQLLQKIVDVCRGTLQATDYYGQKLEPRNELTNID